MTSFAVEFLFLLRQKIVWSKLCFVAIFMIFPFMLLNLICFSNGYYEQQYCKLHHACEDTISYTDVINCDLPPYFKHVHKECYLDYDSFFVSETIRTSNMFVCLNRMDKKDKIFSKKVYPQKSKAKKLSLLLNYTEDYFVCRDDLHDWSFETLKNLSVNYRTDDPVVCDLSDGSDIFANTLVRQMVMDQSFAIKNVSSRIWHVFQDFFEFMLL